MPVRGIVARIEAGMPVRGIVARIEAGMPVRGIVARIEAGMPVRGIVARIEAEQRARRLKGGRKSRSTDRSGHENYPDMMSLSGRRSRFPDKRPASGAGASA
jgi:hypothetical protein